MSEPGSLRVDVFPATHMTFFQDWGDAPAWVAFGLALSLAGWGRIRAAKEYPPVEAFGGSDSEERG